MPNLIGLDHLFDYLERARAGGRLGHFFILLGPAGCGKSEFTREFMRRCNCKNKRGPSCGVCPGCRRVDGGNHPDIHVFEREEGKQDVSVAVTDRMHETLSLRSRETGLRFLHIADGDALNLSAMNAILKILEEPPDNTILLLELTRRQAVLPTIISRAQVLQFPSLDDETVVNELMRGSCEQGLAALAASLSDGSLGQARRMIDNGDAAFLQGLIPRLTDASVFEGLELAKELVGYADADTQIEVRETLRRLLGGLERWLKYGWLDELSAGDPASSELSPASLKYRRRLEAIRESVSYLRANGAPELAMECLMAEWQ